MTPHIQQRHRHTDKPRRAAERNAKMRQKPRRRKIVVIADKKSLVGSRGMIEAAEYQINQIIDRDKAAAIVGDRTERQRHAALNCPHHRRKVSADARAVNQGRPDDDDLQPGLCRDRPQTILRFAFGYPVGIARIRRIVRAIAPAVFGLFAIDLDGTHENETPHAHGRSLPRQIERAIDIGLAKGRQRIGRSITHNVNAGGKMDNSVSASERAAPVGRPGDVADIRQALPGLAGDRRKNAMICRELDADGTPDEPCRSRDDGSTGNR